ncbi:MAG TPA: hypothetical protein VML50_16590 [Anaeromyxobacter sp.]|nr:hypothetical protein [Anaeromyxobacter sp.]
MWQETKRIFMQSSADVLHAIARILPSVFAMLLFVVVAAVLAVLVRWAIRRTCDRLGLDRRLLEWGVVARGAPERGPPSRLVAQASFWAVLLAGAFLGLSVVQIPAAASLSLQLIEYLPRALLALVILAAGVAAARFVERSVLIGAVNMGLESARFIALSARWLVVLLAAAVALEHAGVGTLVVIVAFGTVFGGIVLALALAVGLGARDTVARLLERRFRAGSAAGKGERTEPERGRVHHA